MLLGYPADVYDFCACTQADDGPLKPPEGPGWLLIGLTGAEDGNAAILLVTWARPKVVEEKDPNGR